MTYEQVITALRAADKAGNTEDARRLAEIANRLKPNKKQPEKTALESIDSYIRGPGQAMAQGATIGFYDELRGLADYMMGGEYGTGRDVARQEHQDYSSKNPVKSFGLELGGALLTGIPAAAKVGATNVGKQFANIPRWMQYTGAGAAGGGVAGAGYSEGETPGEIATDAAVGGGIGAGAGIMLPPIMRGAGAITKPVVRAFQKPGTRAGRKLGEAIQRDSLTPGRVGANTRKLGPQGTIADAGGENVLGLADTAVQVPGQGRNRALGMLQRRQMGQHGRVMDSLTAQLGDEQNFYATLKKLGQQKSMNAKPLYQKAYSVEIPFTDDLQQLVKRPVVQDAMKKALKIAANEGDDISTAFKVKGDDIVGLNNPSTKVWDYVKRGLDDVIEGNTSDFGRVNNTGRIANNIKRQLLDTLDEANPDYKQARRIFAGDAANEKALKTGRSFLKEDAEITQDMIAKMSESEKDFFRAGAMRAIRDKLEMATDTSDAYKRIFNKASIRKRLESVFPDKKSFTQFARQMKNEADMYRTRATVTGGSPTVKRMAQESDLAVNPDSIASGVALSPEYAASRGILRFIGGRTGLPPPVRNELSDMLFTQDPAKQAQILQQIEKLNQPGFLQQNAPGVMLGTGSQAPGLLGR